MKEGMKNASLYFKRTLTLKINHWILLCFMCIAFKSYAWNALGHRIIAQIAYEHMTNDARHRFSVFNHALDKVYKPQSFVNSSVWLDTLSYQDVHWYKTMHYIDIPFSTDGSKLPPSQSINAIWAIEKSNQLLMNTYATAYDKGIAFRVLLHVVGDLHQPLHAATKVSIDLPQGDRGGNLVLLPHFPMAKNLHMYWDRGGGLLARKHYTQGQIKKMAHELTSRYPCSRVKADEIPLKWAEESHKIAVTTVYQLPINDQYQQKAQHITEQRISQAGCRLAVLFNKIDASTVAQLSHKRTLNIVKAVGGRALSGSNVMNHNHVASLPTIS